MITIKHEIEQIQAIGLIRKFDLPHINISEFEYFIKIRLDFNSYFKITLCYFDTLYLLLN